MIFSTSTGGALIGEGPKKTLPFKPKGANIMAMKKKKKKGGKRGGKRGGKK